jgi:serine/threonine protein kinase
LWLLQVLKEVRLLQSLDHPNIVSYLDSFLSGDELVIVVEWAAAGDLKRQVQCYAMFIIAWYFIDIYMHVIGAGYSYSLPAAAAIEAGCDSCCCFQEFLCMQFSLLASVLIALVS